MASHRAALALLLLAAGTTAGCFDPEGTCRAGLFADKAGWRIDRVLADGAREGVATTDAGDFGLALDVDLREGESLEGTFGPRLPREPSLLFSPNGTTTNVTLDFCQVPTEGEGYACDSTDAGGGIAGEGDGFAFSFGPAAGACRSSFVTDGRYGTAGWRAALEGPGRLHVEAS